MQPQHVPAWKRLGLKLKYAKDSNDQIPSSAPSDQRDAASHDPVHDSTQSAVPAKRRRTEPSETLSSANGYDSRVLSPSFKRPNNGGLKKKVSFTAETKQLDGDSSKSLIAAWEAENQFFEDLQAAHAEMIRSTEQSQPAPEAKWEEKAKGERPVKEEARTVPRKSRDALDYLTQFHQSRETWKYNKTREVWILKHILSLNDIPPSYDHALAAYVRGLKSRGAISLLTQQCTEAAAEDIGKAPQSDQSLTGQRVTAGETLKVEAGNTDNPERRRADRDAATERFKRKAAERSDEQEARAETDEQLEYEGPALRKKRARMLLDNINPPEMSSGGGTINTNIHPQRIVFTDHQTIDGPSTGHPAGPRKREKSSKKRISAPINLSDSSSEDESDSSDNEESTRKSSILVGSMSMAGPSNEDSTSSSGSDSSSDNDDGPPSSSHDSSDDSETANDEKASGGLSSSSDGE